MTEPKLSRLTDSPLREAWPNEAADFTPWLVKNIDHLSEALGLVLEPIGTEVAVDRFWADVVATEAQSGAHVLIENQLEGSDHTHLGQILTYLAGIDAKLVIWIAREFEEAHRSAIRWLNEHTDDEFAFFAVRLRAVRIADSPLAPVFEVVEKPNTWERGLGKTVRAAESKLSQLRERFWNRYLELHPGSFKPSRHSNVWLPMNHDGSIVLSMYVAGNSGGMFLRGRFGTDGAEVADFMTRHAEQLDEVLGPSQMATEGYYYGASIDIPLQDTERWDELIAWMDEKRSHYLETVAGLEATRVDRGHSDAGVRAAT